MRGQFFNIEYIVGLVIFSTIIVYLGFQIGSLLPEYRFTSISSQKKAAAFRITDFLITSPKVGLVNSPYVMNKTKVAEFFDQCPSNYTDIKAELGLEYDFRLRMEDGAGGYLWCCSTDDCQRMRIPARAIKGVVHRYANLGGDLVEIVLEVW